MKYSEEGVEEIEYKLVFVSILQTTDLEHMEISFPLGFYQESLALIPSLVRVSAEITTMKKGDFSTLGMYSARLYLLKNIYFQAFTEIVLSKVNLSHISELLTDTY